MNRFNAFVRAAIVALVALGSAANAHLARDRAWAQRLALLSDRIDPPIELKQLLQHPAVVNALVNEMVLLGNVAAVTYMVWRLWQWRAAVRPAS